MQPEPYLAFLRSTILRAYSMMKQHREGVPEAMSFYSELKRRNVLRVAAGYIVSAWLLIQIAETILPLFGLGDGPARLIVILLVIGFVPALIVSWIFELTPGGLIKDKDIDQIQATVASSSKRFDQIIMLVLVLALSYFAFDKFVLSESREHAIAENARKEALVVALETIRNNKSIAVLPFADMSENQDQEYFADGMTEELLNELAQLEGLNVTGRTSSFAFKGHNQDLRDIGEQLGVAYILEGSVRKQNDELRITAQLINTQDGSHLWSRTYDTHLDDIFHIQENIARSVAGALSIALDVEGRNHLPGTGTDSVEAYDVFLEGRAAKESDGNIKLAAVFYQRAIDLDPEYAEAWAALGASIAMSSFSLPLDQVRAVQEHGRELVVRAIEIDPNLASAYSMLSGFQWARGDWIGATEYQRVFSALAPAIIPARMGGTNILGKSGRIRDALEVDEMWRQLDPLDYFAMTIRAEHYIQAGRYAAAEAELANIARLTSDTDQAIELRRMLMAFSKGEPDRIGETLQNYVEVDSRVANIVSAVLEEFDSPAPEVLVVLQRLYDEATEMTGEGRLVTASLAVHFGDPELALEIMSKELRVNLMRVGRLWYPHFSEMRKLPGFKVLAADIGFVTYWRKYGWADFCRPLGETDFECE
jgi:TolB-like protein